LSSFAAGVSSSRVSQHEEGCNDEEEDEEDLDEEEDEEETAAGEIVQALKKARTDETGTAKITSAPPIFPEVHARSAGMSSLELPPPIPRSRRGAAALLSAAGSSTFEPSASKGKAKVSIALANQ